MYNTDNMDKGDNTQTMAASTLQCIQLNTQEIYQAIKLE